MSKLARPRIAVIGELNVDMLASGVSALPQMGSEILAKDFNMTLGSASAIFATGMANLGHPVTFVGMVGNDSFGRFCLKELRDQGVSTSLVKREPNVKTGITVSLSSPQDRALVTYPGAIATLKYEHLQLVRLKHNDHLHMTSYFLQSGLRASFRKIFMEARSLGLTTSFDPNSDPSGVWGSKIEAVFRYTDVLFLNEAEALYLTREGTVRRALRSLQEHVRCVVIKRGSKGAVASHDGEVLTSPAFKIKAEDTTGAGDSFDAGFMSRYLRGFSLSDCLRAANACGALSALRPGGTAGQPNERQLAKFLRNSGRAGDGIKRSELNAP